MYLTTKMEGRYDFTPQPQHTESTPKITIFNKNKKKKNVNLLRNLFNT